MLPRVFLCARAPAAAGARSSPLSGRKARAGPCPWFGAAPQGSPGTSRGRRISHCVLTPLGSAAQPAPLLPCPATAAGPCWHPLPDIARAARMEHQGLGENRTAGRRNQEPQQRLVLSFLLMTLPNPQGEHSCPEKYCLSLPASFLSSSSEKHCEKKEK